MASTYIDYGCQPNCQLNIRAPPAEIRRTGIAFCWGSQLISYATEHLSRSLDQPVFALGFLHGPSIWHPSPRDSYEEKPHWLVSEKIP